MTKVTNPKSKNIKKVSKTETEWDDLDIETLTSKVESLELEKKQAIQERIKIQTEHDAILKYCNIASEKKKQLQDRLHLERFRQDDINTEQNAEVQVYLDKMESLKYDFDCKMEIIQQELNASCENEAINHKSQVKENEFLISNLKQELLRKKIECMQEIQYISAQYEEKIDMLRNTLSMELEAFEESCASRQQELEEKLDLKRRTDLSKLEDQFSYHLDELAKKHQDLADSTEAYWEDRVNKNKTQIAKLKEESRKLDKALHDNETIIKRLGKENDQLVGPLSEMTSKVNELKRYLKDEERVQRSLTSTKARIILIDERIREEEKENERLENDITKAKQVIEKCDQDLKLISDQIDSPAYSSIEAIHEQFATLKRYMKDVQDMARKLESEPDSENELKMKFESSLRRAVLEINRLSKTNSLLV